MPREIDCSECEGTSLETFGECGDCPMFSKHDFTECHENCGGNLCTNCENGKIKVYTEAELKEAVQAERDAFKQIIQKAFDNISLTSSEKSLMEYILDEAIRKRGA